MTSHSTSTPAMKHFIVFGTDMRGTTPLALIEAPDAAAARKIAEARFSAWPQTKVQLAAGELLTDIKRFMRDRKQAPVPARRCKCGQEFMPLTRSHTVCSFACALRLNGLERKALHRPLTPEA